MKKYLIGFAFASALFAGGYAFITPKKTVVNKEFCEIVIIKDYLNKEGDNLKVNYGETAREITKKGKTSFIDIQEAMRTLSKEGWKLETSFTVVREKIFSGYMGEGEKELRTYLLSREYTE